MGFGLTDRATDHLVDVVGFHLVPLYRLLGPTAVIAILILFLVGIIRMLLDIVIRAIAIAMGNVVPSCRIPWALGSRSGTGCRSESEIPQGRGSGSNRERGQD
jgi:hypothetical protein